MAGKICEGVAGVEIWEPLVTHSLEYIRFHELIRQNFGKATEYECIQCDGPASEWAWQHGENPRLLVSYEPMCYVCHRLYDPTPEKSAKLSASLIGNTHTLGSTLTEEHKAKLKKSAHRGENHHYSKLTGDDAVGIRRMHATGQWTFADLAYIYSVHPSTISAIIRRQTWTHV